MQNGSKKLKLAKKPNAGLSPVMGKVQKVTKGIRTHIHRGSSKYPIAHETRPNIPGVKI